MPDASWQTRVARSMQRIRRMAAARSAAARATRARRSKSDGDPRLATYRKKRHFDRTPEPSGGARARAADERIFVVQQHAARRLHFDFRLELDGVLLSWSVPKGPSLSPTTRRLAVRTEDHPLGYADFEGIIPEGEYGGGTVVVWDRGTWEPEGDPVESMRRGRLTFTLRGEKLRGRWHLVRTRGDGKAENWLLFKGRDDEARDRGDVVAERPDSVVSGRSLAEVRSDRDRVWHSKPRSDERPGAGGHRGGRKRRSGDGLSDASLTELVASLPSDVRLTNLDKVLYPEQGLSKAALAAYYVVVSDRLLEHAAGRPLVLVRCPDGRHKQCFFQKHVAQGRSAVPDAVGRVEIREEKGVATYMTIDDRSGLLALAQMGVLEIHTWGCHADKVERPDQLVFDIDPDPALGWERVVDAARALRRILRELGLESFVKTTGGKGLHVVAPVARRIDWDAFKAFARAVAERLAADSPEAYTTNPQKARRKGKIFLDYLRNSRGATAVAAYSPRARENAPVATPLSWSELEDGIDPGAFTITTLPRRLTERRDDPWAGYADLRQSITAAARRRA